MPEIPKQVVGLVLKDYPRISETFIVNEILLLEELGYHLHIFASNNPREIPVPETVHRVKAKVSAISGSSFFSTIIVNVLAWWHRPGVYWKLFKFALRGSIRKLNSATMQEFLQAVYLVEKALPGTNVVHLHAHFSSSPAAIAYFASRLNGITYSFSAHANDIYSQRYGFLREKIRRAQFVVSCTEYNCRHILSIAGHDARVFRCYHGIHLEQFKRRQSDSRHLHEPVILSIGRFVPKKGFPVLLHALHILQQRQEEFRCYIIGGGEMHDTLQRLVQVLNLQERVEIIGRISEAQIREYYQQADVFALPCEIQKDGDRDGIPNVLVEAMAMGIPVVSTQISGIPELIENDVNGFLVKDRDPAALADALADVLNDPELAARFGDAGRATVALEFDAKRNVEKIAELLWAALMSQSPHRTSPHTPQSSTLLEQLQAARESTVQTAATLGSDYDSDELK